MTCEHSRTWQVWEENVDDWTGTVHGEWVTKWESWDDDIDVHRFKCRRCGRIGYYSNAARNYYEKGERSPGIDGLE